jgi:hypothetical protein
MTVDRVRHPLEWVTRYGALTEHGGRRQIQRPRGGRWIDTRALCANRRSPNRTPIRAGTPCWNDSVSPPEQLAAIEFKIKLPK